MKRWIVFHDYHDEGWKVVAESDSCLEAVMAREEHLARAGGVTILCQVFPVLDVYTDARYERDREEREEEKRRAEANWAANEARAAGGK